VVDAWAEVEESARQFDTRVMKLIWHLLSPTFICILCDFAIIFNKRLECLLAVCLEFAAEIIPVRKSHTDTKFCSIRPVYNLNQQKQ